MMRFLRRPVSLVVIGILIIAVALATLFQYSTVKTLALAESLQFRRMLVAQQAQGTYRFFFVTNRREAGEGAATEDMFSNERAAQLRFGLFDTEIEPSLGIGMLINPSDWFQNEEIQLRRVESLGEVEFFRSLRSQVDASPGRSLLININGFRERFPSALRKTAFLAHVLDLDTPRSFLA